MPKTLEDIAMAIAVLNRAQIKEHLMQFRGPFKLDFTDDYLESLSEDRLRHILLAAITTAVKHRQVQH